jgi:hypothetical protein
MYQVHSSVEYAGFKFIQASSQTQTRTDNSNVRLPYFELEDGERIKKSAYGAIKKVVVHHLFPGGPSRCVLHVDWFTNTGQVGTSGNVLVDTEDISEVSFVFISDCYQIPVAVWPHDPLNRLKKGLVAHKWSEIIDKNQEEI